MRYSLERTILFFPEKNTLTLINDLNTEIKLSNQASRLLKEMIANKNTILNREDLLKKVWDDYGFTASNNSLNIAISEIRKAFSNLGVNPGAITTIHKKGFQFNAEINLITDAADNEITAGKGYSLPYSYGEKLKWRGGVTPELKKKSLYVLLSFFSLFIIKEVALYIKDSPLKKEKITYVYSFNKCNIFTLGENKLKKEALAPVFSNEKINCDKDTDIFFKRTGGNSRVFKANFIGICLRNNDKGYVSCRSLKISGE